MGLVLGVGGMQVPMGVGGMQVPMQLPMGMDLGHMMMPSGGRDARDAYAGGYLAPENEVGFIEGFLLVVRDHLPSGFLQSWSLSVLLFLSIFLFLFLSALLSLSVCLSACLNPNPRASTHYIHRRSI